MSNILRNVASFSTSLPVVILLEVGTIMLSLVMMGKLGRGRVWLQTKSNVFEETGYEQQKNEAKE